MDVLTNVEVVPATPGLWTRLGRVFGPREKNPDSCWCQRFRRHDALNNRTALRREFEESEAPVGLLALVDGEVAGWTRVVPRATLPGILNNRALARLFDDQADAWWVSCFVVRREYRGAGLGVTLLRGAVDWAFESGAAALDGHPVDVAALRRAPAPSAVFTGTLAMFRQAGFTEIARTCPSRPVMRRERNGPPRCSI
ncbi:GNAT family N-acetyltransferase [Brevibacterium marinum]|nr:GNAT family N-acetyltransferase [Brevibacterium marinum]